MAIVTDHRIPIEADLLILSFLGHFTWEILQAPLFSSLEYVGHFAGILICLRSTLGDLAIALTAFWCAAIVGGGRHWATRPSVRAVTAFISVGLLATVAFEFASTEILNRWSYADEMPSLPLFGTGVAPFLQWLIVPTLVLWYLMRLARAR